MSFNSEPIQYQPLGAVKSYSIRDHGIDIDCESSILHVNIFTPTIIQIEVGGSESIPSYSVVATPTECAIDCSESNGFIVVATDVIELQIEKATSRLTFLKGGKVLSEEDTFGTSSIGNSITTYKKLQKGERFIGLGEKTGNLDRRGSGYTHWNVDAFGYTPDDDPLYCSTPFYMGLHHDLVYGIFLDNPARSTVNFGASNDRFSSISVEAGNLNYFFIHEESVAKTIESYTWLTGRMELPPLWSVGFQQCRYSYYPDTEVLNVAHNFRDRKIPADAIVLDIHYMDDYKIFTWDNKKFPDPKIMIDKLKEMGFEVVVIFDPGIKIEEGYKTGDSGLKNDVFLKYPDGQPYRGEVWPGWCHFPDFTNQETRTWWGEQMQDLAELGVKGYWNDMNEIATWGQKMPELVEFDYEGKKATAIQARNIYGMQMARSTFEGAKKNLKGTRPFNLTRAGFSGIQRFAAVWTGDNVATEEHMLLGARLNNSLGLAGVSFSGYDIGGFVGESSVELFTRWITIGAFSPFFRGHSMINSRDSEPWSYGEETEEIARNYINLRYRLLPYIYSCFYESTQTGLPLARSLAIDYSFDDNIYNPDFQNQFLFGPNLLIAPVRSDDKFAKVYIPEGEWYGFHNGEKFSGKQTIVVETPLERLPIFLKASGIIPTQRTIQYSGEKGDGVMELHLYAGANYASFEYYEDDGKSYEYQNDVFYKRKIEFHPDSRELNFGQVSGTGESKFLEVKLILHGFEKTIGADSGTFNFLDPISKFDPFHPAGEVVKQPVHFLTFDLLKENFTIKL